MSELLWRARPLVFEIARERISAAVYEAPGIDGVYRIGKVGDRCWIALFSHDDLLRDNLRIVSDAPDRAEAERCCNVHWLSDEGFGRFADRVGTMRIDPAAGESISVQQIVTPDMLNSDGQTVYEGLTDNTERLFPLRLRWDKLTERGRQNWEASVRLVTSPLHDRIAELEAALRSCADASAAG